MNQKDTRAFAKTSVKPGGSTWLKHEDFKFRGLPHTTQ